MILVLADPLAAPQVHAVMFWSSLDPCVRLSVSGKLNSSAMSPITSARLAPGAVIFEHAAVLGDAGQEYRLSQSSGCAGGHEVVPKAFPHVASVASPSIWKSC